MGETRDDADDVKMQLLTMFLIKPSWRRRERERERDWVFLWEEEEEEDQVYSRKRQRDDIVGM